MKFIGLSNLFLKIWSNNYFSNLKTNKMKEYLKFALIALIVVVIYDQYVRKMLFTSVPVKAK